MQGARRGPCGTTASRANAADVLSLQPFGTGQISPHAALSPPDWVSTQRRRSALPEGKSAAVAARGILRQAPASAAFDETSNLPLGR